MKCVNVVRGAWGDHSQYPGRGNTMTPLSPFAGRGNAMTCVANAITPPLPPLLVVVPTTHACDMCAIRAQAIRFQAL